MQLRTGLHIPDPESLVVRGRDDAPPIERDHGIDALAMSLNAAQLCSRFQVPQSQGVVILAAGDDTRAVQSRQFRDPTFVLRLEGNQFLSGLDIPECQGSPPCTGENLALVEQDEA